MPIDSLDVSEKLFVAVCPVDLDSDCVTPSLILEPILMLLELPTEWLVPADSENPWVRLLVRLLVTLLLKLWDEPTLNPSELVRD